MNIRCWLGFHDPEWSHSNLISPINRETFYIYFLIRCRRCDGKRLFQMIPSKGFVIFPMQKQTVLTEEEFKEWSWVDPSFQSSPSLLPT